MDINLTFVLIGLLLLGTGFFLKDLKILFKKNSTNITQTTILNTDEKGKVIINIKKI